MYAYKRKVGTKFVRRREESEQVQFVRWVKQNWPQVIIYTDHGAGLNMSDTQRIAMMKMRSRDGMPDIYIDYPSRDYHGARFEFKKTGTVIYNKNATLRKQAYTRTYRKNGKIYVKRGDHLKEQSDTLKAYNEIGYFGRFALGLEHAKELFLWYMDVPQPMELELPF